MALEYTKAPTVTKGSPVTSVQWNKLADAFNDRFLGGVGDPTYRLHWYLHSIFRGFRNQADALNHPAHDEWWKFYAHIEPLDYDYPVTPAGEPEGINVRNPLGGFVFGNDEAGIYNEPDRLNYDSSTGEGILLHNPTAPSSDLDHWEIGKYQRGVTDSTGEDLDQANALVAAQHHLSFRWGHPFYHKGYGGWLPIPSYDGLCPDGLVYNRPVKFRKLDPETDCEWSSCPEGGGGSGSCPNTSKGVYTWFTTEKHYVLVHWDGSTTKLLFEDYIEGPYTDASDNAFLGRKDGDQISRILNFYANEFRGNDSERAASDFFIEDTGFDFQSFFERQYYLAPAYGVASGYGDGSHNAVYTQFDWNNNDPAGYGTTGGTDNYDIHSGFVCAGFIAVGDSLTEDKTFTLEVDGVTMGSVTINGTTEDQSAWFEIPKAGNVKISCDKAMGASESAYCEIAEILEMKPANEDAYLVLRMGSANTTNDDGDGRDTSEPKTISDDYLRHGMIFNAAKNATRSEDTYINRNPVYMTARKYAVDRTRMVERALLTGYEVSGGKSILYFNRKARGVTDADVFRGIAPSEDAIASGSIEHNVEYIVDSGTTGITYDGNAVAVGSTFTGEKGVSTFTKTSGDEVVKEYDGIISEAGEGATDNRWSMFLSTVTYKAADNSEYKPDSYGDILGYGVDRCAFYSQDWTDPTLDEGKEMLQHVAYPGGRPLVAPESPSGYRYGLGTHNPPVGTSGTLVDDSNSGSCDDGTGNPTTEGNCAGVVDHYTSCQIYVPDYEIESVVMDGSEVKVTLSGRLRRNSSAPSTVTNSSAGWNTYLSTESGPRTDENAVVEYLRWSAGSGTDCTNRVGDTAPDAPNIGLANWVGKMNGSCLPRFYFTRLIPKVYEDGNNVYETQDTRMWTDELVWMDLVLRAICEGYVDEASTNELRQYTDGVTGLPNCYSKRLFDYTYENLFNAANSNRWPRLMPLTVRSDNPKMFGPFPNVYTYAEHYNQIARAVNLLYKARLYLPVEVQWRRVDYEGQVAISVEGDGNCNGGAVWQDNLQPPAANTFLSYGSWQTETGFFTLNSYQRCRIDDDGGQCILKTERRDIEYSIHISKLADNALPDDLLNLVNNSSTGFAAAVDDDDNTHTREVVADFANARGSDAQGGAHTAVNYQDDLGQYQYWTSNNDKDTTCEIVNAGTLVSDAPSISDFVDTIADSGQGAATERVLNVDNIEAFLVVPRV